MTKIFKIEGMSCGHCKARVEKVIGELSGVSSVQVSLEEASASVVFDDAVISYDVIKEAIEDAGYDIVG